MKTKKTIIIEKAAHIIMNTGLEALTIQNLAAELDVNENQLHNHQLTKDDDILLMLLIDFETELNELVHEYNKNGESPETELKLLFKRLYFLFLQKPYYLSIIFDKSLKERDDRIKKSFLRIRNIAENYLTTVINTGKMENTFKTKESTRLLVGKILSGFRLFMKDEQRVHEMILELKTLKTLND